MYTHTYTSKSIGFAASFRTSFRKVVREEFNRISLDCSFFLRCADDSPWPCLSLFPSSRESLSALIVAKTRSDNCRRLNPLSQIASCNFFFLASYSSMIAAGMSLNAVERATRNYSHERHTDNYKKNFHRQGREINYFNCVREKIYSICTHLGTDVSPHTREIQFLSRILGLNQGTSIRA